MNADAYKQSVRAWYEQRLKDHGQGIKALSSGTEARRLIRFGVLTEVGIEPGCSVLDVGCGFADYYAYLKEQGCDVAYSGVDLVPEFIARARRDHPGLDLQVRDLQADPVAPGSFDFVVCSQALNIRFDDESNTALVQDIMRLMFAAARKGVAIDLLSDYVDFRESYLIYHSPETMFRFAKTLSRRVVLRHDYPLFEFCLYVYPDFEPWARSV